MTGRRRFHTAVGVASALFVLSIFAQDSSTQTDPALHHRTDAVQPAKQPAITKLSGVSSLPANASGEYIIDEEGSVVEITIEHNQLTGYITKLVERESTLTFFFDQTTLGGRQIRFTTKQVHGMWYSFDGEIVRGQATSEAENGFYLLRGSLVLHSGALHSGSGSETTMVSYRSTPRSDGN